VIVPADRERDHKKASEQDAEGERDEYDYY
jgi:hypothetical protein